MIPVPEEAAPISGKSRRKRLNRSILILACALAVGIAAVLGINSYIKQTGSGKIVSLEEAANLQGPDCILVLGCGVWKGGTPSPMLADRLERSVELYESGVSGKLLMSGDHGHRDYDEVNVMKEYAVSAGIPSEDVFMDHAGFSTYESIYRAKAVFNAERVVLVSQSYHLYRALYIAKGLGLEACGVGADQRQYVGRQYRETREALARVKDFFIVMFKPEPAYLGEIIPVSGDGDLTND